MLILVNKFETLNKQENLLVRGRSFNYRCGHLDLGMLGLGSQRLKSPMGFNYGHWGLSQKLSYGLDFPPLCVFNLSLGSSL